MASGFDPRTVAGLLTTVMSSARIVGGAPDGTLGDLGSDEAIRRFDDVLALLGAGRRPRGVEP